MHTLSYLSVIFFLVSACAGAPSFDEINATAQHIAATGVAQTLTAAPSQTPLPSATFTSTVVPSATASATPGFTTATTAPFSAQGTQANALPTAASGTDRANKNDATTPLLLQNNTDQVIWLIIDSPMYLEYRFSDSLLILVPQGDYHYRAYIGGKGPFQGSFHIGNQDKHTLVFSANKVQFQGP